ncbi:hypothetical protein OROHE_014916 [Orobanche hederae]
MRISKTDGKIEFGEDNKTWSKTSMPRFKKFVMLNACVSGVAAGTAIIAAGVSASLSKAAMSEAADRISEYIRGMVQKHETPTAPAEPEPLAREIERSAASARWLNVCAEKVAYDLEV